MTTDCSVTAQGMTVSWSVGGVARELLLQELVQPRQNISKALSPRLYNQGTPRLTKVNQG